MYSKKLIAVSTGLIIVCIIFIFDQVTITSIINNKELNEDNIPLLSLDDFRYKDEYSKQCLMFNHSIIIQLHKEIRSATPADFNNDGYIDFAIVYLHNYSSINIFYNMENLSFSQEEVYTYENDINELFSGDYDNDGDQDIIFFSDEKKIIDNISYRINGTINILFNDGDNNFLNKTLIAKRSTGIIRDPEGRINLRGTSSDYDMDGDLDLLVGDNSGKVEFYLNNGKGNFTTQGIIHDFGSLSWGLASADFDIDGDVDFIVAATEKSDTTIGYIFLKYNQINDTDGDKCFNEGSGEIIANNGDSIYNAVASLSTLDCDNDGDKDILVGTSIMVYLLVNNGVDYVPFVVGHSDEGENGWELLQRVGFAVADYNNDGWDDFVFGAGRGILRLFINNQLGEVALTN